MIGPMASIRYCKYCDSVFDVTEESFIFAVCGHSYHKECFSLNSKVRDTLLGAIATLSALIAGGCVMGQSIGAIVLKQVAPSIMTTVQLQSTT